MTKAKEKKDRNEMSHATTKGQMSHVMRNLFMPYANNKGADQPAHPRSLISAFVVRCLDSTIPLVSVPEISSFYLALTKQACWSLIRSQAPPTADFFFSCRGSNGVVLFMILQRHMRSHSIGPAIYLFVWSFLLFHI